MKKFLFHLIGAILLFVPILLFIAGFCLATGPVWDVAMLAGATGFVLFSYRENNLVYKGQENVELARTKMALAGIFLPLLLLAAQAVFCGLHGKELLVAEGSLIWFGSILAFIILYSLHTDRPESSALTIGLILAACWILICVVGGLFDFYENLTDGHIPSRITSMLGVLSPITAVSCVVMMFIGIIQENR